MSAADPRATGTALLGVSLKLYLDLASTIRWARDVAWIAREHPATTAGIVRLFVLPSFPALAPVRTALDGSGVLLGAQDLHWSDRGAYTGAVSGVDLRDAGCRLVEVGHVERRVHFGEGDDIVALKLAAAYRARLTPVLCIGETTRTSPIPAADECVARLDGLLAQIDGLHTGRDLIVAYEPAWAIGGAAAAEPSHVATVTTAIRRRLDAETALATSAVIYGGSAQPGTLSSLGDAVDGLFLGRFAHDPNRLAVMIDEAARVVAGAT